MADTIRETNWCNPYWRHFEKRGEDGSVKKEVYLSDSGRMIVEKHWMGGLFTTRKETHVQGNIPGSVFDEVR